MAIAASIALIVRACLTLSVISLAPVASAQQISDVSTNPQESTDWFSQSTMALSIQSTEDGAFGSPFDVIPLTLEAGFQQHDANKLPHAEGELILLDYSNFTQVDYTNKIVFLSCDSVTVGNDSDPITPSGMLNSIMRSSVSPVAVLLYSTTKAICFLGGTNLPYNQVWTMANEKDAIRVRDIITMTNINQLVASISPSMTQEGQKPTGGGGGGGGTSAIAMSILYSITGLITLLFLFIIGTGAVRAHRNPERYGPRAGVNGRPRRSRARGIAMAMLETLPIVKFGESDERKPDEENASGNHPGTELQPRDTSQASTGATLNSDAVLRSSSEGADDASLQRGPENAPAPTGSTPPKAKEPEPENDNPGCSICTEDFTVGEDVRVLPCNHKFHPACVDPWLVNVSGTCPLCRLDLRPPEEIEREGNLGAPASPDASANTTAQADSHLAPPTESNQTPPGEVTNRRRRSRLLDWNRLRHASVDERLQALRLYRQSQQSSDPISGTTEDERRHSRLTDRLRERFHIRSDSRNDATTPETPLPSASTVQH